jgi:hypothetical protein
VLVDAVVLALGGAVVVAGAFGTTDATLAGESTAIAIGRARDALVILADLAAGAVAAGVTASLTYTTDAYLAAGAVAARNASGTLAADACLATATVTVVLTAAFWHAQEVLADLSGAAILSADAAVAVVVLHPDWNAVAALVARAGYRMIACATVVRIAGKINRLAIATRLRQGINEQAVRHGTGRRAERSALLRACLVESTARRK